MSGGFLSKSLRERYAARDDERLDSISAIGIAVLATARRPSVRGVPRRGRLRTVQNGLARNPGARKQFIPKGHY